MVYIIGGTAEKREKLKNTLEEVKIDCNAEEWSKYNKLQEGLFIILSLPKDSKKYEPLLCKNSGTVRCISLTQDKRIEKYGDESVLKLPEDIPYNHLRSVVRWTLAGEKSRPGIDILKSFFEGAHLRIFFINAQGKILQTTPAEETFIGYISDELLGQKFEEIFGLSPEAIDDFEVAGNKMHNLTAQNGTETPANIMKLNPDKLNLPGMPAETAAILILSELLEYKTLKEKNERLALVQSHLVKQRAAELEAANELLVERTSELQNALKQLESRNKEMIEELTLASELQISLLPREFPKDIPLNFSHKYMPYAYIGGDFFDIHQLDDTKVGIVITDVSGHGVAAAFVAAMFKSAYNHLAGDILSPAQALSKLNKEFSETLHTDHYLTAFYSIIDTETLKCTYCNAGHPKQLLIRADGKTEELTSMGFFIGMFEGTEYEEKTVQLYPGDRLFFFTDGIMEVINSEGKQFGREHIIRVLQENKDADTDSLSAIMLSELMMYMAGNTFDDDITMLITEVAKYDELEEI